MNILICPVCRFALSKNQQLCFNALNVKFAYDIIKTEVKSMKHKTLIIISVCIISIVLVFLSVKGVNSLLTELIEKSNIVCYGQKFTNAEDAVKAMENQAINNSDSLDYLPPYNLKYTFEYDDNTIIFYEYNNSETSYEVGILKHNDDGTLSFDNGCAELMLRETSTNDEYYYFTNINTSEGSKSISFLYLPEDSNKDVYIDGIKAEKELVSIDDREFYICYAVSDSDTFLSNLFTPISKRHTISYSK